jgi:dolichol-phosphate mannosyltransferase
MAERATLSSGALQLCVVVPTFNERDNLEALVSGVAAALRGIDWELIIVDDDSPDGTAEAVRGLARQEPRLRCLQRIGRRGLSSAAFEGMLATGASFVAVMDGDMQHDETLLPKMLTTIQADGLDIVVGSRYVIGGGVGDWDRTRHSLSRLATYLGHRVAGVEIKDPMSGFFMLHSELVPEIARRASGLGYKILLDIITSAPRPLKVGELPFQFKERFAGESKLSGAVVWEYFLMLIEKYVGGRLSARFIAFTLIGLTGVAVHLAMLTFLFKGLAIDFIGAQAGATLLAMTSNFVLNNIVTYHDKRLVGVELFKGWLSFVAVCSVGGALNLAMAAYLFQGETFWVVSALTGALVGGVWNYGMSALLTWRK